MEQKTIKVSQENRDLVVSKARLFEWKIEKEEKQKFGSLLTLTRDNETPYYSELVKLEEEYGEYKFLPFFVILIPAIMAFLIITALLIIFFAQKDFARQFWYIFVAPSGLFLLVSVLLTFLRMRILDQVMNQKPQKDSEYSQKVKKLKDNIK